MEKFTIGCLGLILLSCSSGGSSTNNPDSGTTTLVDSGHTQTTTTTTTGATDTGSPATDTGSAATDTGSASTDTGSPATDTGSKPTDSATSADTTPADTATVATDSAVADTAKDSSVACPSPVLAAGDTTQTVQVGSLSRTYILHVPTAYKGTSAVPLVVDFHPIGGSDTAEEGASPFKAVTDPEGVVTAYPQGEPSPNLGAAWDVGPCCVSPISGTAVDDVAFAKALVAQVETKACIDTTRVYAVGFSMGGGMSHYLACHAADVFAAVAPQSFDLLQENEAGCTPVRPIPELSFRGTADNVAIYAGGYSNLVTGMAITFLGAKATWEKWASIDGCTDTPAYPATPTSATWNCAYYKSCQASVQVGLCINNGGHEYGDGNIGWTFLKQFTLP